MAAERPNSNPRFHLWFPLGFLSIHSLPSLSVASTVPEKDLIKFESGLMATVASSPAADRILFVYVSLSRSVFSVSWSLSFRYWISNPASFSLRDVIRFDWYCLDFDLGFSQYHSSWLKTFAFHYARRKGLCFFLDSPCFFLVRICWSVAEPLLGLATKSSFRDSWAKQEGINQLFYSNFLVFVCHLYKLLCSLYVQTTAVYQYGGVDINGQVPSFDRSLTPLLPSDAVDPSVCYVPNAYQQHYYYGW